MPIRFRRAGKSCSSAPASEKEDLVSSALAQWANRVINTARRLSQHLCMGSSSTKRPLPTRLSATVIRQFVMGFVHSTVSGSFRQSRLSISQTLNCGIARSNDRSTSPHLSEESPTAGPALTLLRSIPDLHHYKGSLAVVYFRFGGTTTRQTAELAADSASVSE